MSITRLHSDALDLDIKHDSETGTVTVKDLYYNKNEYVEYSPAEQKIFNIFKIDKTVHNIKKVFCGEIVDKKYNGPPTITETGVREPNQIDLF